MPLRSFVSSLFLFFFILSGALAIQSKAYGADLIGIKPGLRISYASPSKFFDADGESRDIEDAALTLVNLNLEYSPPLLGLLVGLDLPYVSQKFGSNSESGIGDLSLYGGYRFSLADTLSLTPKLRVKLPTGDEEKLEGYYGHTHIQPSLAFEANMGLSLGIELGYMVSLEAERTEEVVGVEITKRKVKVDPGDVFYANLLAGYWINDMIRPRVNLIYAMSGNDKAEGQTIEKSSSSWLALAGGVDLKLLSTLYLTAELGTSLEPLGANLPYGYVLSGKNTLGGGFAITLAGSVSF
jgi:hypothetical protein